MDGWIVEECIQVDYTPIQRCKIEDEDERTNIIFKNEGSEERQVLRNLHMNNPTRV